MTPWNIGDLTSRELADISDYLEEERRAHDRAQREAKQRR